MKTHLSHILPVWKACDTLGRPTVQRIVTSLLELRRNTTSRNSPMQADDSLREEIDVLVDSLFFRPPEDTSSNKKAAAIKKQSSGGGGDPLAPPSNTTEDSPSPSITVTPTTSVEGRVPAPIAGAWKRWLTFKPLALDKASLVQFLVPANIQPHSGPSGHMGLYDCLIYTLQGHAPSSAAYGTNPLIWVPDVIILMAVCKAYRSLQEQGKLRRKQEQASKGETTKEETNTQDQQQNDDALERAERIVWTMALLTYRMYDSYQKKGTVARDTIHRFLTDVHGEDSYKEPKAQALLDIVFDDRDHAPGWLQRTVGETAFCKRVLSTADIHHGRSHLLLDWFSYLVTAMIPAEEIPLSVSAFLDTMGHQPRPLSETYALADHRLFEIKRRFHSLVQSSSPVIQGDPMGSSSTSSTSSSGPSAGPSSEEISDSPPLPPKHAIREAAFCQALTGVNEEMGHGGYMPMKLARLIFRAGCRAGMDEHASSAVELMDGSKLYWGLYHVVQFGCIAVRQNHTLREDPELSLLRFLFSVFQQSPEDDDDDRSMAETAEDLVAAEEAKRVLTRDQVTRMLAALIEYADFRLDADSPPRKVDETEHGDEDDDDGITHFNQENLEDTILDVETVALLGLYPPTHNGEKASISLKKLVNYALDKVQTENQMTFDEFCSWNKEKCSDIGPRSRLSPLMMELRLVAAILFGIPPTMASLEVALVAEIERRHRCRYPSTDVSRRGPRGTVWYLIDSAWFRNWESFVKQVSGTSEDQNDGRGDKKTDKVRGLHRISNTGLLVENGSLALRPGICWKRDYEILPPLAWSALQAWYDGGPPIYRTVVRFIAPSGPASPHSSQPRIPTENEIELYPFFVTIYLCDVQSRGEARPFQQNHQLSRVSPVGILLVQLCRELDVDPDHARLWVISGDPGIDDNSGEEDWILNLNENIVDQRKRRSTKDAHGQLTLLLEIKDKETGLWPRGVDGKEWAFRAKVPAEHSLSDVGDGVVGLYNMGNTCYLNSSIQCLSHTPIFREYFTSRAYLRDINTTNPLGHKGQLASVSAVLINSLWKRFNQTSPHQPKRIKTPGCYAMVNAPALTPKTFKDSLGKFNDHFSGNEQHDAQELLAFLLGGLSEDLNRIVDKPYIEAPDSDGRPDSELADIWWSNHLKREMSIIVALFTGQYKSLLTCRSCKYESARFEPFSFLQLPLPEDDHHSVNLVLYPLKEGADAMKYCVRVHVDGDLNDVIIALAKVLYADEEEAKSGDGTSSGKKEIVVADAVCKEIAQNLAVVDLRDAYIMRIAPRHWKLQDLQNKDTGELPMLHIYELEPISEDETEDEGNKQTKMEMDPEPSESSTDGGPRAKHGYLALAQRRSELVSRDFLHPLAHRIFGTPMVIRINNIDLCTGRALYDIVARRLRNFVPKSALRFLAPSKPSSSNIPESKPSDQSIRISRTSTDMEDVSAGSMPRYGFRLRLTSRDGRRCLSCPWYEGCIGCLIHDTNTPADVMDGDSIVVDWHFAVDVATAGFGRRASPTDPIVSQQAPIKIRSPGVTVKSHRSCSGNKKGEHGAITLEECLDAFAREEKIPEAYCSKCKDFRVQMKRMSLWRLPPVVIIHLKRFQFTQHMRRKLKDLVVFPIEGLDLSRIMAQESETAPPNLTEKPKENGEASSAEQKEGEGSRVMAQESETAQPNLTEKPRENGEASSAEQKEGESEGEEDRPDEQLKDSGRSENLYDLYGVVHHQGALSGGHYVASLKSELDGQWRLFNDAQIFEIHARDVVDPSAYILFYIRRDVSKAKLSDFWDIREGAGMSEDEMDQLLKGRSDRCVIS